MRGERTQLKAGHSQLRVKEVHKNQAQVEWVATFCVLVVFLIRSNHDPFFLHLSLLSAGQPIPLRHDVRLAPEVRRVVIPDRSVASES